MSFLTWLNEENDKKNKERKMYKNGKHKFTKTLTKIIVETNEKKTENRHQKK